MPPQHDAPPIALPAAVLYAAFDSDPEPIVEFLAWLRGGAPPGHGSARVLDVGCGVGRLLAPLASRGWHVIGMEPDPEFAEYAAKRVRQLPRAEVRRGGFGDVEACAADVAPVDVILGINGSFAYLETPAARADALSQCRRVLAPGGQLVLDLPNLLRILFEYQGPATHDRQVDGRIIRLTRRHRLDYDRALFITEERYEVQETTGAQWELRREHPYAITSWPELASALGAAGFVNLRTFTSFAARSPESVGPGRLLIVAQAG